jgi:hypothetical protein
MSLEQRVRPRGRRREGGGRGRRTAVSVESEELRDAATPFLQLDARGRGVGERNQERTEAVEALLVRNASSSPRGFQLLIAIWRTSRSTSCFSVEG